MAGYPAHRFHPGMKADGHEIGGYRVVKDSAEDEALKKRDPLWRDVPYNADERADHVAGAAKSAEAPKKPVKADFGTVKEYKAAVEAYNQSLVDQEVNEEQE